MHGRWIALPALAAALAGQVASAALVTITSNQTQVIARADATVSPASIHTGTTVPDAVTITATAQVTTISNQIVYGEAGGQTQLANALASWRAGGAAGGATGAAAIHFTVSEDSRYDLAGWFGVEAAGAAGLAYLSVQLWDLTTVAQELFRNDQRSEDTVSELFTVGETGGDDVNILRGTRSGQLLAGHSYWFHFNTWNLTADLQADDGAGARGWIALTVDAPHGVPEPATLPLLLLAAGAAWGQRRSSPRPARGAAKAAKPCTNSPS